MTGFTMLIKQKFTIKKVLGESILIPADADEVDLNALISVGGAGEFILQNLENADSADEIAELMLREYEVSRERARADAGEFLDQLKKIGII